MNRVFFPEERKNSSEIVEFINELSLASRSGFKSKHDDCLDTISMLGSMTPWKPSQKATLSKKKENNFWDIDDVDESPDYMDSYIV